MNIRVKVSTDIYMDKDSRIKMCLIISINI